MSAALNAAAVQALGTGAFTPQTVGFLFTALSATDKGCFPSYGRVGIPQTLTAQGIIGSSVGPTGAAAVDAAGIQTGLVSVFNSLCVVSGTCCTTNLCNSSYILIKNIYLISLLLSIAVAKLIF